MSARADKNYALWLRCGSHAAALVTLGTEYSAHSDNDDVAEYLVAVQSILADLEPIELALTAAWLGRLGADALIAAHEGDTEAALEDVREIALTVAITELEE